MIKLPNGRSSATAEEMSTPHERFYKSSRQRSLKSLPFSLTSRASQTGGQADGKVISIAQRTTYSAR